jgi:hypothetical protein
MTDARTKTTIEIEALLAERRKYEQWLAQLDARKDSTPSHVFVKVHSDYTARLADAQEKISAESGAVQALVIELEDTLAKQESQIAERADERAEAELRAAVGEFAGKEWDKLRTKLDSAIADLSGERDGTQRELDSMRALLSAAEPLGNSAATGAPSPEPVVAPKVEARAEAKVEPKAEPKAEPKVETKTEEKSEKKGDVDDIAFLRSVLGRNTPYASGASPAVTEAPTAERAPARTSVPVEKRPSVEKAMPIAELATTPAPAPAPPAPRASAATSRPSTGSVSTTTRPSTGSPAIPSRPSAPELFAMPEIPEAPSGPRGTDDERPARPSGTFGQATPRTSEAVKSLKCQECGTLNYPTEWYCERCGGELAAF